MGSKDDAAARAASRTSWLLIALFCAPGVALVAWYLYMQLAPLKDGRYSCEPQNPLVVGQFWTGTIADGRLVDMKWDGFGKHPVKHYRFGDRHGTGEFSALVDGIAATCAFRD
jgi:hypothetical protein